MYSPAGEDRRSFFAKRRGNGKADRKTRDLCNRRLAAFGKRQQRIHFGPLIERSGLDHGMYGRELGDMTPAETWPPCPVRITLRTSGASLRASNTVFSPRQSGELIAFRLATRFNVTMASPSGSR